MVSDDSALLHRGGVPVRQRLMVGCYTDGSTEALAADGIRSCELDTDSGACHFP